MWLLISNNWILRNKCLLAYCFSGIVIEIVYHLHLSSSIKFHEWLYSIPHEVLACQETIDYLIILRQHYACNFSPICSWFVFSTCGIQIYLLSSIWHLIKDHIATWSFWIWNNDTVFNHERCPIPKLEIITWQHLRDYGCSMCTK